MPLQVTLRFTGNLEHEVRMYYQDAVDDLPDISLEEFLKAMLRMSLPIDCCGFWEVYRISREFKSKGKKKVPCERCKGKDFVPKYCEEFNAVLCGLCYNWTVRRNAQRGRNNQ